MAILRPRLHWPVAIVSALLCCLAATRGGAATSFRSPTADELSVKAAFLLNFAAFVEWPADAFGTPSDPVVVGVYGDDPFGERLEEIFSGEAVGTRRFVIRRIPSGGDLHGCHIVFIADSERSRLPAVIPNARAQPILTVANAPEFNELGGIVEFTTERGRVRFRINRAAAKAAGLVISSRLLRLAEAG